MTISYGSNWYFLCEDQNEIMYIGRCSTHARLAESISQHYSKTVTTGSRVVFTWGKSQEQWASLICVNNIRLEKEERRLKEIKGFLQLSTQALPSSQEDTMPHPLCYVICKCKLYFTVSVQWVHRGMLCSIRCTQPSLAPGSAPKADPWPPLLWGNFWIYVTDMKRVLINV